MARTIPMPSIEELPEGPRRAFVTELRRYYRAAGLPSLRKISQAIERHPDPRLHEVTASAETIRRMITGKVLAVDRDRVQAASSRSAKWLKSAWMARITATTGATASPRTTGIASGGRGISPWRKRPMLHPFPSPCRNLLRQHRPGFPRIRGPATTRTATSLPSKKAARRRSRCFRWPTGLPVDRERARSAVQCRASSCCAAGCRRTRRPGGPC